MEEGIGNSNRADGITGCATGRIILKNGCTCRRIRCGKVWFNEWKIGLSRGGSSARPFLLYARRSTGVASRLLLRLKAHPHTAAVNGKDSPPATPLSRFDLLADLGILWIRRSNQLNHVDGVTRAYQCYTPDEYLKYWIAVWLVNCLFSDC